MLGMNELTILFYFQAGIVLAVWSDFVDPRTYARVQNGVLQAALSLTSATPKYAHEDQ